MGVRASQETISIESYYRDHPGEELSIYAVAEALGIDYLRVSQAISSIRRRESHIHKTPHRTGLYTWRQQTAPPATVTKGAKKGALPKKGDDFLGTVLKVRDDGTFVVDGCDGEIYVVKKLEI